MHALTELKKLLSLAKDTFLFHFFSHSLSLKAQIGKNILLKSLYIHIDQIHDYLCRDQILKNVFSVDKIQT